MYAFSGRYKFYSSVAVHDVIEKNATAVNELVAPMRGTQWQPF